MSQPLDIPPKESPAIISFNAIRKGVGVLGILLPVILVIGSMGIYHCDKLEPSISHYYYTRVGSLFTGTLSAIALFLFSYKGFDNTDKIACKLASIFALGIVFFPTSTAPVCCVTEIFNKPLVKDLHFLFAGLFFSTLSFLSLFQFTKSKGYKTVRKKMRNKVYIICGIIMIVSMLLIAIFSSYKVLQTKFQEYSPVFIFETTALWAFGLSWLIKGEFLLKDN